MKCELGIVELEHSEVERRTRSLGRVRAPASERCRVGKGTRELILGVIRFLGIAPEMSTSARPVYLVERLPAPKSRSDRSGTSKECADLPVLAAYSIRALSSLGIRSALLENEVLDPCLVRSVNRLGALSQLSSRLERGEDREAYPTDLGGSPPVVLVNPAREGRESGPAYVLGALPGLEY